MLRAVAAPGRAQDLPPSLELGAGTGRMAVVLAEAWKGSLRSYIATDLDVRVPALRQPPKEFEPGDEPHSKLGM